jgi:transcriptional regulator with XRE-family HTH domain
VSGTGPDASLGEFIRSQREMQELTLRQFAEMVGISNPYLSLIERGLRDPSENVVGAIAQQFELDTQSLFQQAGVAPNDEADNAGGTRAAIESDKRLTSGQRRSLLEVYEAFVAARPASRD